MLARVWFDSEVGVGWFTIDGGGNFTIVTFLEMDVKKRNGTVLLILACELDTGMNLIETLIEVSRRVGRGGGAAAQALSRLSNEAPAIVHIYTQLTRSGRAP